MFRSLDPIFSRSTFCPYRSARARVSPRSLPFHLRHAEYRTAGNRSPAAFCVVTWRDRMCLVFTLFLVVNRGDSRRYCSRCAASCWLVIFCFTISPSNCLYYTTTTQVYQPGKIFTPERLDKRYVCMYNNRYMECPDCKSKHTVSIGSRVTVSAGNKPRRQCRNCGRTFYPAVNEKKEGICVEEVSLSTI